MEGEAAGDQNRRVDHRQNQLEFINRPWRQGVHGPIGEVSGKEAGEGHAIGHQKGGQPKHAQIGMLAMAMAIAFVVILLLQIGVNWGGGGHGCCLQRSWPRTWFTSMRPSLLP